MRSKIVRGGGHLLGFSQRAGRLTRGLSFGKLRALAGMSAAALVVLLAAMIFPALPEAAQAVEGETEPGIATLANSAVGVDVPASIDFEDVKPTTTGATTQATANVKVTTSNSASYELYIYAADGDNSLRPKISSLANISQIKAIAGDVGLSSLESNTWGYTLGTSAAGDDAIYRAVPTDASAPVQTKDTSATNAADDTYVLTLAAKVDTTIASGAYSNTLTFAVVAEPAMVTVAFNGNGATSGSMSSIKIPAGDSQALPGNTFVRSGYDFTGWNTAANGGGTSYSNGATLTTTTAQAGQTITLYAQWKSQVNYIQNFTLADCQSQASSGNVTVVDSRDNNSYTVRYINGACWMTQNLRLAGGTKLTTSDSNVTRDYTLPTTQLAGNSYSYTAPQTTISSNTSYGGYYNYCAASAGTVCSSSSAQNASQDICPKGWRLPTLNEMSGITSYTSAFSPVYSGYYNNGSLYDTGSYGYWWSATAYSSTNQYYLNYNGGSLNTNVSYKYYGFSVRCIRSS